MPFIAQEKRLLVDKDFRLAEDKGDLCYAIYKVLMARWTKEPRWTTIHNIYKELVMDTVWLFKFNTMKYSRQDAIVALHLAWQVFFTLHIMPYEEEKRKLNGDI